MECPRLARALPERKRSRLRTHGVQIALVGRVIFRWNLIIAPVRHLLVHFFSAGIVNRRLCGAHRRWPLHGISGAALNTSDCQRAYQNHLHRQPSIERESLARKRPDKQCLFNRSDSFFLIESAWTQRIKCALRNRRIAPNAVSRWRTAAWPRRVSFNAVGACVQGSNQADIAA